VAISCAPKAPRAVSQGAASHLGNDYLKYIALTAKVHIFQELDPKPEALGVPSLLISDASCWGAGITSAPLPDALRAGVSAAPEILGGHKGT
jgi:hypothetical protein